MSANGRRKKVPETDRTGYDLAGFHSDARSEGVVPAVASWPGVARGKGYHQPPCGDGSMVTGKLPSMVTFP